ncbi:hypothetical protein [Phycicoccus jejuensis]|uniref:hypothetical protein n=1 Tax=Phycicoccus jejuensis TaxID=367299 RepID=UPI0004C36B7C|nr:hypothetical protein [Phycicoccus jejuensis]
MAYGFRIFGVQAFENRVAGSNAADASIDGALHRNVLDCLQEMEGRTYFQKKRASADPDPLAPKPRRRSISIRQYEEWANGWVHLSVSIGREGDHDRATAEGQPPLPINERSAESRRLVTMVFPPAGDRFLMVSEAIGASDAHELLLKQLTTASMKLRDDTKVASQEARRAARAAGVTPLPKVLKPDRYIFRSSQLIDGDYLDELLARAETVDAVFTLNVPSPRGGSGTYQRKRLVVKVEDEGERRDLSRTGQQWYKRKKQKDAIGQREAIAELDAVLHLDAAETAGFDEVAVKVRTRDAETVTIGPLTAREVFTYPLSWSQCSPVDYYRKIEGRLRRVAALNDIEMSTIDSVEAARCLPPITDGPTEDSTQATFSEPPARDFESEAS